MKKYNLRRYCTFFAQLIFAFTMAFVSTASLALDQDDDNWSRLEEGLQNYQSLPSPKFKYTSCTALGFLGVIVLTDLFAHNALVHLENPVPFTLEDLSLDVKIEQTPTAAFSQIHDLVVKHPVSDVSAELYREQLSNCTIASSPALSSLLSDIHDGFKEQFQLAYDYPNELLWEQLVYAASMSQTPALQTALGYCHLVGKGVVQDKKRAVELFTQAAAQNFTSASFRLGICYLKGIGVSTDAEQAARLFQWATTLGNVRAGYALAYCYFFGIGVSKNESEAKNLLMQTAQQGYPQDLKYSPFGVLRRDAESDCQGVAPLDFAATL